MDDLPKQKNFYDVRRQFQGRDQPTDSHPSTRAEPPPRGQIIFGVILIAFVGFLAYLKVKSAREELTPTEPVKPAATQAAPAKH